MQTKHDILGSRLPDKHRLESALRGDFQTACARPYRFVTTPAADTRAWTSLPAGIGLSTGQLRGEGIAKLSFESDDSISPAVTSLNARNGKCAISWGRTHSSVAIAVSKMQSLVPDESGRDAANAQFRNMLGSTFSTAEVPHTAANK